MFAYAMGVRKAYGYLVATWYTMLLASQFHIWYYASRTLPNMFAFGTSMQLFSQLPRWTC